MLLDPRQHRRHSTQSQRADQCRQAKIGIEIVGHREDVLGWLLVEARGEDRGEPARCRSFGRRAEVQPHLVAVGRVDVKEQWRLAFGHRLHRRFFEIGWQSGQFVGELQQQGELVLSLDVLEVRNHFGQGGRHGGHGALPGSSPTATGTRTALPHSVHEPS